MQEREPSCCILLRFKSFHIWCWSFVSYNYFQKYHPYTTLINTFHGALILLWNSRIFSERIVNVSFKTKIFRLPFPLPTSLHTHSNGEQNITDINPLLPLLITDRPPLQTSATARNSDPIQFSNALIIIRKENYFSV